MLDTLPAELAWHIAEHLPSKRDVAALTLTTRNLRELITPLLYREVAPRTQTDVVRLCNTLIEDDSILLAKLVRSFTMNTILSPSRGEDTKRLKQTLPLAIARMSSLKHLSCVWISTRQAICRALTISAPTLEKLIIIFMPGLDEGESVNFNLPVDDRSVRFGRLRELALVDLNQDSPLPPDFVRQILTTSTGTLKKLNIGILAQRQLVSKCIAEQRWVALEHLDVYDDQDLLADVDATTVGKKHCATDGFPALVSITCYPTNLPFFFPPSASSECERHVSSLTISGSPWEDFCFAFAKSVSHCVLAQRLKEFHIKTRSVDLEELPQHLFVMRNLEILTIVREVYIPDVWLAPGTLSMFGTTILPVLRNLRNIIIDNSDTSNKMSKEVAQTDLQQDCLTTWDADCPYHKLSRVEFGTPPWAWTRDGRSGSVQWHLVDSSIPNISA